MKVITRSYGQEEWAVIDAVVDASKDLINGTTEENKSIAYDRLERFVGLLEKNAKRGR